ncbi:helix-turn-helix domain-containing protein [Niveibacterium sp. 24ML]|uniref:Mor transcription activator family protein n=1 Tax=Niveibacterium sp. 24ML TaxID=2985512 RepID=UPI00226DF99C|nr:Mor transcription activator family protein [Niveibacterium sp. 24ML]MCX9155886.1 helix-turn-helix domain-containing protein [Niveibacterium sp. 24ML]
MKLEKHEAQLSVEQILASALVGEMGMGAEQAKSVAAALMLRVSRARGGEYVYIPQAPQITRRNRRAQVLNEFKGNNHDELAAKHGVSRRTIYNWVAKGSDGHGEPGSNIVQIAP